VARPKAFDETEALEAAMGCFWEHGYAATSVRDLTERMGIAGPSLYNAFGDKRALFVRALEHYCAVLTRERLERLETTAPPTQRIPLFLGEIVDRSCEDKQRRGCFLINSAIEVAPHDPALAEVVSIHLAEVRAFFIRSLTSAKAAGQIPSSLDTEASANHLMAVLLGIRVLARTGAERSVLESIVSGALTPLGLQTPWAIRPQ
jgi:TetR/AcrR family transcriptional repressor of nem operon